MSSGDIFSSSYRLERLYFRYLQKSPFEYHWSLEDFADTLNILGYIEILEDGKRYRELPKFKSIRDRKVFWATVGKNLTK